MLKIWDYLFIFIPNVHIVSETLEQKFDFNLSSSQPVTSLTMSHSEADRVSKEGTEAEISRREGNEKLVNYSTDDSDHSKDSFEKAMKAPPII